VTSSLIGCRLYRPSHWPFIKLLVSV
jgi:hypothetical protein